MWRSCQKFRTALSKSSPPRCSSPFVASTSNTRLQFKWPDTSNVPPPLGRIRDFLWSVSLVQSVLHDAAVRWWLLHRVLQSYQYPCSSLVHRRSMQELWITALKPSFRGKLQHLPCFFLIAQNATTDGVVSLHSLHLWLPLVPLRPLERLHSYLLFLNQFQ